jgi:O-antigen/teichoic acid export membrane protein
MSAIPFLNRARTYTADSLFRNAMSLVANLAIKSGCGYGGLVLLTHVYSVQAVGLSAAAMSASSLVVGFTQFGTDYSLPRYLPTSKNREALINTLHTGIMLSTPVVSVAFLLLPAAHKMFSLGGWLFAAAFIMISTLQAGVTFLGLVMSSDRASATLTTINIIPNAATVVAPPVFTVLGNVGSFLARGITHPFSYAATAITLARRGHRFRPALRVDALRGMVRFSLGMYAASTIGGLPPLLIPIIVLSRLGADGTAYWSIAYTVATLFYLLPSMITRALMPEISSRPAERKLLLRKAALLILALVFPALIIAYVFAPIALVVFGHKYVASALVALRWLIAAGFISAINYLPGAILFLAKKSGAIVVINVVNAAIVLALGAVWAVDPREMAITWFAGTVANTALFGLYAFLALRQVGYRLAALGGDQHSRVSTATDSFPADAPMPAALQAAFNVLYDIAARQRRAERARTTGSLTRAFDVLSMIAEQQQRGPVMRDPSQYNQMTEPHGLFSVLMLQEAERSRFGRDDDRDHPGQKAAVR